MTWDCLWNGEKSHPKVLREKIFLKISQHWRENTFEPLFNKVADYQL